MNGMIDKTIDMEKEEHETFPTCPHHPEREAPLRCYQCGQPMCIQCAKRTPVGYICPNCLARRKQHFEQATLRDLVLAGLVALILGGMTSLVLMYTGWFVFFLSPLAGLGIAELAWRVARRHYSRRLKWVVVVALGLSALPMVFLGVLASGLSILALDIFGTVSLFWSLVHSVLMLGAAWRHLK